MFSKQNWCWTLSLLKDPQPWPQEDQGFLLHKQEMGLQITRISVSLWAEWRSPEHCGLCLFSPGSTAARKVGCWASRPTSRELGSWFPSKYLMKSKSVGMCWFHGTSIFLMEKNQVGKFLPDSNRNVSFQTTASEFSCGKLWKFHYWQWGYK